MALERGERRLAAKHHAGKVTFQLTSAEIDAAAWQNATLDSGKWRLAVLDGDEAKLREEVFGSADAIAVTGDFNGDGTSEIGIYFKGSGSSTSTAMATGTTSDLWAQLGTQDDLPVTGDWDGDGKDDIGIYGPAWPRDPRAIEHEPGLPDPDNPDVPEGKMKNVPPHRGRRPTADGS